jgi:endonuclease YncB( thermonuclease family)
MQQDAQGNMLGVCSLGHYDIGAAIVNAGWAVAHVKYTHIYVPYENQARQNNRGLWQGQFYMPWDWRAMQAQRPKIKVIRPKEQRRGILGI